MESRIPSLGRTERGDGQAQWFKLSRRSSNQFALVATQLRIRRPPTAIPRARLQGCDPRSGTSPLGNRHSRRLQNGKAKSFLKVSSCSSRYAATPIVIASCGTLSQFNSPLAPILRSQSGLATWRDELSQNLEAREQNYAPTDGAL